MLTTIGLRPWLRWCSASIRCATVSGLGDTGANVLGGALGLAVVLDVGRGSRNVILVVLVVLNVAAELVSFSRVIDAVPPLRAFDRLGRRRVSAPRTDVSTGNGRAGTSAAGDSRHAAAVTEGR